MIFLVGTCHNYGYPKIEEQVCRFLSGGFIANSFTPHYGLKMLVGKQD